MTLTTFDKIKERKIVQWALAYLAFAWLVLQVVVVLGSTYDWSSGFVRAVPVMLAIGFIGVLVVAWYHGEKGQRRVSGLELGILSVLLLIAGLGVTLVGGGETVPTQKATGTDEEADAVLPVEQASVAVLPFENISDEAQDYFASGLTEELLATMARVPDLKVAARTSAFAFRDSTDSTRAIGRALGVAHLIEGSVRKAGNRVRVTARLIDAASGSERWTDTYSRSIENIFAVQEEIARSVARELRIRVGDASLAAAGTENAGAYESVLRGRAALERREGPSAEWIAEAEQAFKDAIDQDDDYAAAWGGLARVRVQKAYLGFVEDEAAMYDSGRQAAEQALKHSPTERDALYALGLIELHHAEDYVSAAEYFQRSIDANPSDARSLALIGWALHPIGQEPKALRLAERAVELDPLSVSVLSNAAAVYMMSRRLETAAEMLRAALALEPEDATLLANRAIAISILDRHDEAVAQIDRSIALAPSVPFFKAARPWIYARAGREEQAREFLEQIPEDEYSWRAATAWHLGDRDLAFEMLENEVRTGKNPLPLLKTDLLFDPMRDDPKWDELIALAKSHAEKDEDAHDLYDSTN